jgi:hypothetical protein
MLSECDFWILSHNHWVELFLELKLLGVSFSWPKQTVGSKYLNLMPLQLLTCLCKTGVPNNRTFWITSGWEKSIHVLTYYLVWIMNVVNVLGELELTFDVTSWGAFKFIWVLVVVRWTQTTLLGHWDSSHNHCIYSWFIVILTEASIHLSHKRSRSICWIPYVLNLRRSTEDSILKHGIRFIDKHILSFSPVKLRCSSHSYKVFPQVLSSSIL